jgi:hypothetical protein
MGRRPHQGPSGPPRRAGRRGRSAKRGLACIGEALRRVGASRGWAAPKGRSVARAQRTSISTRKEASHRRTAGRAGPWRAWRAVILICLRWRPLRGAGRISQARRTPPRGGRPAGLGAGVQSLSRSTREGWPVLARAGHLEPVSSLSCAAVLKPLPQRGRIESLPRGIHARGASLRGLSASWLKVRNARKRSGIARSARLAPQAGEDAAPEGLLVAHAGAVAGHGITRRASCARGPCGRRSAGEGGAGGAWTRRDRRRGFQGLGGGPSRMHRGAGGLIVPPVKAQSTDIPHAASARRWVRDRCSRAS